MRISDWSSDVCSSDLAVRIVGQMSTAPSSGARILVNHKAAGVALLVTPWNFPAAMATRKIGPALAAGCTVVIKPASATPLTMLALMSILEEAGRSEERRVGKEGGGPGRSRWLPDHEK